MSKKKQTTSSPSKKTNNKRSFKEIWKKISQHKGLFVTGIISAVVSVVCGTLLGNLFLREFMATLIEGHFDTSTVTKYGLIVLALFLVGAVTAYLENFCMSKISVIISKELRSEIANKINKLPLSYIDRNSYGDLLSRMTNDVDTVGSTLERTLSNIVSASVTILGIPIIMFIISWQLTLVSLLQIPLALLVAFIIVKYNQKYFVKQQVDLGKINGYIEENFSGHNVVKAFNGEAKAQEEFNKINTDLKVSSRKAQFYSGLMHPIINLVSNIVYVLICLVGAYIAIKHNDATFLATITVFMIYSKLFNQPISTLGSISSTLQSTFAAADRVFEFLFEKEEPDESDKTITLENVKGKVEFKNVNFGYTPDKKIIHDFNFTAKPGQKIAIVGQTGAGKTTMVNLLMRFYEVNSGQILIDDVPTTEMSRTYVRSLFGMVLQETWLFEGTIMDNLKFGRPEATDEEVVEACKLANVDHFIRTQANGYNMFLTEDTSISAGQKQLLTIARAMIQNAPMLILDEATSSVDTRTEILIQTAMDRLTKHKTSFVIAHRLSTIKNADQIIVMKDGNIVEVGKHKELLARNGVYTDLYQSQFEAKDEE